jgi:hypothetical protein
LRRIGTLAIQTGSSPQFSIANAQQVLPLPEVAFEAHAFGNLKRRDEASLDLLAAFARRFAN